MQSKSKIVETNQSGIHDRLADTVKRHLAHEFQRPYADHSKAAFDRVLEALGGFDGPWILDSCCGVGDSTRTLAQEFPDHLVIGIDKSAHRLSREREGQAPANMCLVRGDLNDLYRMIAGIVRKPDRHYLLYPNPWPKSVHLKRRWHGSPVFGAILKIGGRLELRSNWHLYLEEFSAAALMAGHEGDLMPYNPVLPLTPFEKKYTESDQQVWKLVFNL